MSKPLAWWRNTDGVAEPPPIGGVKDCVPNALTSRPGVNDTDVTAAVNATLQRRAAARGAGCGVGAEDEQRDSGGVLHQGRGRADRAVADCCRGQGDGLCGRAGCVCVAACVALRVERGGCGARLGGRRRAAGGGAAG
ncbi:hypothetical protein FGB62_56g113 [Gracilaria domingensis]|nr:hypothetical protein FGB62_56g113 [Gracilaria domingensis]